MKLELKKGLKEVKELQLLTKMCQMTSIGSFTKFGSPWEKMCHPIRECFCSGWGIGRVFSDLFRCSG